MNFGVTISSPLLSPLFHLMEKLGLDREKFILENGISENIISSADKRLPLNKFDEILSYILDKSNDKSVFLKSSKYFSINNFGVVGYIMINSKTLGDAVAYLEKYYRIISDTDHLKAYNQKDKAYLTYALLETSYKSRIHTAEIILSYIYKALKFLTKNSLILDEVVLCYKKPEYYRLYEEVFNAPVKFSKTHNSLVFDKNYLEIPLSQPSRELFDMFEKYAQSALNKLNPEHYYSSKVWEVCRNNFASGIPKIEDVARVFLMTGRNLQFKLREEGTSFRKIVTELVKEVATSYLKNVNLSIAQVSHLAGFSQPSAFNRSYKRWTGKSPGEHRSEIV